MLNNLMLTAALRGLTIAASSFVVGKGYMTGDEFQTAVGALTAIATLGYSVFSRNSNKMVNDTAKLPVVSQVLKKNGEVIR